MGLLMINICSQTKTTSTYQPLLDKGPPVRLQKEMMLMRSVTAYEVY
jgi:hypothetical protein